MISSQTFILASIAAIASADEHAQNKIAQAMSMTDQMYSQVQTLGLAQILAKGTSAVTDAGETELEIHPNKDEKLAPPASEASLLAQVD